MRDQKELPEFGKIRIKRRKLMTYEQQCEADTYRLGENQKKAKKEREALIEEDRRHLYSPTTAEQVSKDVQQLVDSGFLGEVKWEHTPYAPVQAVDFKNRRLQWPRTHNDWKAYGFRALRLVREIHEGRRKPTWGLVCYRDETQFRAGTYSAYHEIWLSSICHIPSERYRYILYKLVRDGASLFDNQANVSIKNRRRFRGKTQLATMSTIHPKNRLIWSEMEPGERTMGGFKICGKQHRIKVNFPCQVIKREGNLTKAPYWQENNPALLDNGDFVTQQIKEWIQCNSVQYVGPAETVQSPIRSGIVLAINQKKDKLKLRLCTDGGAWSSTTLYQAPCPLDTLLSVLLTVNEGDYMTKWDDKSGLHQMKLDDFSSNFSHFTWGGHVFRFHAASFGFGRIPADFQLINTAVVNMMRVMGYKCFLYLDDRLVIEKEMTEEMLKEIEAGKRSPKAATILNLLMTAHGGYVSKEKCTFLCSQRMEFLGIIIDTKKMTIEIPDEKWEKFTRRVKEILKMKKIFFKDLQTIRGKMCSFILVIRNMQLYIRELTRTITTAEKNDIAYITLNHHTRKELELWISDRIKYMSKTCRWVDVDNQHVAKRFRTGKEPKYEEIHTDASGSNGGWFRESDGKSYTMNWTGKMRKKAIAVKEAEAILVYLKEFAKPNSRLLFRCDNSAVCYGFEKGSREKILNSVIREINMTAVERNILTDVLWIGTKEQKADLPSRTLDLKEEILKKDYFKWTCGKAGFNPNLDGAATYDNRHCARYISRVDENSAIHTDFLSYTPKTSDRLFIFPPKNAQTFFARKVFKHYSDKPFIFIYHVFSTIPFFVPSKPKTAYCVNLSERKDESPTLIPSKKEDDKFGYYKPPNFNCDIYAIINNP